MMKRFSLLALLPLFTLTVFSQAIYPDTANSRGVHFFQPGKTDFGLNLGSSFTTTSGFGSAMTSNVTPHMYYNLSKRFRIGGGISMMTTNYLNAHSWSGREISGAGSNGNYTTAAIFISGDYLASDRLTLSGSAFKIFPVNHDPLPYNPFNPVSRNGAQGASFNVDYKIGSNMHIQAGIRYSDGLNPCSAGGYYSDPFQQGSLVPGFGNGMPRW